jgi:hypothetical protein
MKRFKWPIILGLTLILLSAIFYFIHYLIFRDVHHIFIYLVGDIAFVFIEVLLVTIIIHRLLTEREKRERMEKLNMLIGTFFSEVGTELLKLFSNLDPHLNKIRKVLDVDEKWTDREFLSVSNYLKDYNCEVKVEKKYLKDLLIFLNQKKNFVLMLMLNPNLLEHESFTKLLQALSHLSQELSCREDIDTLPDSDCNHLAGDIKRVYSFLSNEWVNYMKHLKDNYPYLFSLAMRTNPFDENASPIVK